MFKKTSLLLLLGVLLSSPLSFAQADGGMIPYYSPDYKDIYEPSQTALIVYNEGMEDLYIKAGYEGETDKFVWIVPTPSYPKAELAPYDIFDELSIYTRNERSEQKVEDVDGFAENIALGATNVIVHSQEQVGIYEVTVLSATGVDGLYDWLEENNYPVKEDIKDVLDWYIEKEWYFTVMRIDPSGILDQIISDFDKEVDIKIIKDNLAEELASYYYVSFLNKDYNQFQKSIDIMLKLVPREDDDYYEINEYKKLTEDNFFEQSIFSKINISISKENLSDYDDDLSEIIQGWIYQLDYENNIDNVINDFNKEIDNKEINKDNFPRELATYYIESITGNNFEQFQKAIAYFLKIIPYDDSDYDEIADSGDWIEEDLLEEFLVVQNFSEEEILDGIDEVEGAIKEWIGENNPENIDKYSDYIEPIKISFRTNSIVYPLKISQISTRVPEDSEESLKTNEVLLYVLSETQVKAPEFNLEFNKEVSKSDLEVFEEELWDSDLESLKNVVADKNYYLTKMRRDFSKTEMDEDLYLIEGKIGDNEKNKISDVIQIQVALERYYTDIGRYPKEDEIDLGPNNSIEYQNSTYLNVIPQDPETKQPYQYHSGNDGLGYEIVFNINSRNLDIGYGQCLASPSGIECEHEGQDDVFVSLSQSYNSELAYQEARDKIKGSALSDRLKGKIIIKVEDDGKAYYINPTTKYSHYLGRPADAFSVMREQGIGIKNVDISNIPVALSNLSGNDADGDGLPDKFEDAIGTDVNSPDTDGDGFSDKQELEGNFDPKKAGGAKQEINNDFAGKQKGKILLQVEQNGEAWYINPEDGKRYFLGRPADAFQVMRNLGLGISNENFDKL